MVREWGRIGLTGFGGPPAHIALLRKLMQERSWMHANEFEDAIAATGLLPGPASTQLAIFCASRVAGPAGAVIGGLCFIVPAVVLVIVLSALFLGSSPPLWVRGAGAGAGSAVAAVAVQAGLSLIGPSWRRAGDGPGRRARWCAYVALGGASGALLGPYLVLLLLGCGLVELAWRARPGVDRLGGFSGWPAFAVLGTVGVGGLGSLAWVAFKVGALSYGGGFVIIPLMQHDAVHTYHWMSSSQFLNAVALGQVTPGPVVATVSAVGYAAHGVGGGVLAAVVAFLPSFTFVLVLGGRFGRLRTNAHAQAFLDGAGPAAIGAILGAAIPLAAALDEWWQFTLLGLSAIALLLLRRGVVETLVAAGVIGAIIALAGGSVP